MNAVAQSVLHEEKSLQSRDGTKLVVHAWSPGLGAVKAQALIVHGYFEHGARYREIAHVLANGGIGSFAVDLRGHGKSGGQRGYCGTFDDYLDDVQAAWELLTAPKRFIVAHSFGALTTLDFVSRRQPEGLTGVVLTNPFLGTTQPVPGPKLFAGKLAGKLLPRLSLPSGVDAGGVSHDAQIVEAYRRDPLVFKAANAGWFRESSAAQARVKQLTEFPVPLYYMYSLTDPVAAGIENEALSGQLEVADKTVTECTGLYHELLNETDRAERHASVRDWILKRS